MLDAIARTHAFMLTIPAGETSATFGPWAPRNGFEVGSVRAWIAGQRRSMGDATMPGIRVTFFRQLVQDELATPLHGPLDVVPIGRRVAVTPAQWATPFAALVIEVASASGKRATDLTISLELEPPQQS